MNVELQLHLHKCLEKIGLFSPAVLDEILAHCILNEIKKDSHLLKRGEVCNTIQFLI